MIRKLAKIAALCLLLGPLTANATHIASQHSEDVDYIDYVFGSSGRTFDGILNSGTLDWFLFGANAGDVITIETLAITGQFDTGLSLIQGLLSVGDGPANSLTILSEHDDGGSGLLSLINFTILSDGAYAIALGGYSASDGNYLVSLSGNTASVPEPATLALFGLGLAGTGFSRRKKA